VNKSNIAKTNAVRVLDGLGIAYTLHPYEVDESDLSAETVARKVGLPLEQVYKTLLVESERREHAFAVVAGGDALDLKAVAKSLGWKSAEMVALKEVQPLTGYIRGGGDGAGAQEGFPGGDRRVRGGARRDLDLGRPARPSDLSEPARLRARHERKARPDCQECGRQEPVMRRARVSARSDPPGRRASHGETGRVGHRAELVPRKNA
jgi:Cys-tRNA(Pro)/Cys-tRNA(Cys) deacylase